MVAGVAAGGSARLESGSGSTVPVGVRRTTRQPPAQRSVRCSLSGALSRLPFSSATAASHASVPGATSDTAARQVSRRPPLSLLRTVTDAWPPSVSSGSGCSPGPSPTSTAAPSSHTCHTGRAALGPPWTQMSPDFLVASSMRARSSSVVCVMGSA